MARVATTSSWNHQQTSSIDPVEVKGSYTISTSRRNAALFSGVKPADENCFRYPTLPWLHSRRRHDPGYLIRTIGREQQRCIATVAKADHVNILQFWLVDEG